MTARLVFVGFLGCAALSSFSALAKQDRGGTEPVRLKHTGSVTNLAFTPGGKSLLAFGSGRLTVWDVPAGTQREAFGSGQPADAVAFAHGDGFLASAAVTEDGQGTVFRVWDLRKDKRLHERAVDERGKPTFLAVSPDGDTVAARQRGVTRFWDLRTGERADPAAAPTFLADIAFAADGKGLVLVGKGDRLVVWDGFAKRVAFTVIQQGGKSAHFAVSPNGRVLGVSFGKGPAGVALYDFHGGERIRTLGKPSGRPSPLAFSPDGRCLATAEDGGAVRVWRLDTGEELNQFTAGESVGAVAFSPDGKFLASAAGASVLLLDVSANARKYARPAVAVAAAKLEQLWADLGCRGDGERAARAVWGMVDAPGPSLHFLAKRLHPQALDAKQIEQWLKDLQADRYATRVRAHEELARLAESARPWLEKCLEGNPDVETRRRVDLLLHPLDEATPGPEKMRLLRALEVLECIGTPEACRLLEQLAGGDAAAWLTRHARACLDRVRRYPPRN
jgi:hypothetical protein